MAEGSGVVKKPSLLRKEKDKKEGGDDGGCGVAEDDKVEKGEERGESDKIDKTADKMDAGSGELVEELNLADDSNITDSQKEVVVEDIQLEIYYL